MMARKRVAEIAPVAAETEAFCWKLFIALPMMGMAIPPMMMVMATTIKISISVNAESVSRFTFMVPFPRTSARSALP